MTELGIEKIEMVVKAANITYDSSCIEKIEMATKAANTTYDSSTGKWLGIDLACSSLRDLKNCINKNINILGQYEAEFQRCNKLFTPYKFALEDYMREESYRKCLGELANKIATDHPEL